ncbi:protein tolR [Candidatus Photodesmus blepharus]|uniref:Protein tolR n=1 Tax=Candidatus Photodesmus blepharonis TaxID=1179155 RepID=A0A084CP99_9GAMM|nr:biopolymer transporter ExbD [Candidatus Photodesmus blepharus]KEY91628.1 protein tolR [Candidatus Photodesmus blepharus]
MLSYQPKKLNMIAEINFIPYIDVVLVLLIVFMVASPLAIQDIDVELPKISRGKSDSEFKEGESNIIIVEINKEGKLGLSVNTEEFQRNLSLQDILLQVKAELLLKPSASVLVGADAGVSYSKVVFLLNELSKAHVQKVGLLTTDTME